VAISSGNACGSGAGAVLGQHRVRRTRCREFRKSARHLREIGLPLAGFAALAVQFHCEGQLGRHRFEQRGGQHAMPGPQTRAHHSAQAPAAFDRYPHGTPNVYQRAEYQRARRAFQVLLHAVSVVQHRRRRRRLG
jgi:hypothetical protein